LTCTPYCASSDTIGVGAFSVVWNISLGNLGPLGGTHQSVEGIHIVVAHNTVTVADLLSTPIDFFFSLVSMQTVFTFEDLNIGALGLAPFSWKVYVSSQAHSEYSREQQY